VVLNLFCAAARIDAFLASGAAGSQGVQSSSTQAAPVPTATPAPSAGSGTIIIVVVVIVVVVVVAIVAVIVAVVLIRKVMILLVSPLSWWVCFSDISFTELRLSSFIASRQPKDEGLHAAPRRDVLSLAAAVSSCRLSLAVSFPYLLSVTIASPSCSVAASFWILHE
jgi:hypothetical protein